jgi:hypothetical protein
MNCLTISLNNSEFYNLTSDNGGAIYIEQSESSKSDTTIYTINNITIKYSSAEIGGGLYLTNTYSTYLNNSLFSNNEAYNDTDNNYGSGGSIYFSCSV